VACLGYCGSTGADYIEYIVGTRLAFLHHITPPFKFCFCQFSLPIIVIISILVISILKLTRLVVRDVDLFSRVADDTVIPPDLRRFYSEKVISMPHSYFVNGET
jgi:hypothetical protein